MSEALTRECIEVKGKKIYGYCGDHIFEILKKTQDFYEIKTLEKWTFCIENAETILDVGANLGNHTLYWENRLGAKQIYCFEPYEPNYENLVRNVQANKLEKVVFPIMKAVGKHGGKVKLENVDQSNFGGTTFQYADGENDGYTEIISIDEFVKDNGVKQIGLIKIDTEGFEMDALQGAMNTLHRDRPFIWVEVSNETHKQVREMLEGLQYDLADVEAFNMLFIPNEKNIRRLHVSDGKILDAMFLYETKANLYYKNYETAKRWNEESKQKVDMLREEGKKLQERLEIEKQNYEKAKEWHQASQQKNEALAAANEQLTKQLETTEQNYQKAKEWHQASQQKNEALIKELEIARQETEAAQRFADEAEKNQARLEKQRSSDQKQIRQLNEQLNVKEQTIQRMQSELDQYTRMVARCIDHMPDEIEVTEMFVKRLEQDAQTRERCANLLAEYVNQSEKDEAFVQDMMRHVNKLQAQANYLKKENRMYQTKLDKITSVWYGRLGIKVYKTLKQFRARLKNIINR